MKNRTDFNRINFRIKHNIITIMPYDMKPCQQSLQLCQNRLSFLIEFSG